MIYTSYNIISFVIFTGNKIIMNEIDDVVFASSFRWLILLIPAFFICLYCLIEKYSSHF